MDELLQQIFNLEDPIGRTIVYWIRIFFWVGVINYGIHIARIIYESVCLLYVRKYIKDNHGLDDVSSDLLNKLGRSIIIRTGIRLSAIYRRIRDLDQIKQNGGEIDNDVFGDIHAGAASRKAGLSNYILGILIVLGLVGTLWGLTTAVIEVQPLLEDIDDLDQLPQISNALQETLKGMGTAFKTTLAGLVTSLGLGALGWFFSLANSIFLTQFEAVVATEVIPRFKQTPESIIESAVNQLQVNVGEFKLATEDNVRKMQESIQQLSEKSWDAYLEQQYVIANELGEIPKELRESLERISEYQVLIKSTVEAFENMTSGSLSKISEYQSAVDAMVDVLSEMKNELQVRSVLEAQNEVFGRIESHLKEQRNLVNGQRRLMATLDNSVSQLEQTFLTTSSEEQRRTEELLQHLTLNFVEISEKMDMLNNTMSKPGLYRWGAEVRRWFGIFRKRR